MQHYMPEIFWHDRKALLSVHFSDTSGSQNAYKIVTTSVQKEVRIWNFEFVKEKDGGGRDALAVNFVANLVGHGGVVNVARFSANGELLASGDCDGQVCLWKIGPEVSSATTVDTSQLDDMPPNKENWVRMRQNIRHDSDVCSLCWSPDSRYLATVSNDESILVYNVKAGCRLWMIRNFRHFPNGVVWDPRGKYLVAMSTDRKLDIIDAAKGSKLKCIWSVHMKAGIFCGEHLQAESYKLFHDDQLISFSRGPDFTPDGELLIVPCAHLEVGGSNVYGTYIFRRCDFDKERPYAFLPSPKPTFRVACSPIIFELRRDVEGNASGLPYRMIWAVLTRDSVTVYDSQCAMPFAYVDNIHFNALTDLAWSTDGTILLISSLEGYCSFIRFNISSLGVVAEKVPDPPQSPQLIMPKKTPKRVAKVEVVTEGEKKVSMSAEGCKATLTALKNRDTANIIPTRPKNTLLKYLARTQKSPEEVKKNETSSTQQPEADKKEVTAGQPTSGVKVKKRAQLQPAPLITID
uniref:Chromatin assembly factor 1 subunit B n=1 Tax=Parascaris univalens TaxID=6257 RepID=A0A915BEW4_PARUN